MTRGELFVENEQESALEVFFNCATVLVKHEKNKKQDGVFRNVIFANDY